MTTSDTSKSDNKDSGLEKEDQYIGSPSRDAFWELLRHILNYKTELFLGLVLALSATLSTLAEPWILGHAIDAAIIPGDKIKLKDLAILLGVVEVVRVGSLIGETYVFAILGQKVMQDLRVQTFSKIIRMPVAQFDRMPVGRLVTRVTNDVSSLSDMFSSGFVTIIGNVLVVAGTLVLLVTINWRLGLLTAAVFPFLVAASAFFSQRLKAAYTNTRARLSALNGFLAENVQGMRTLHSLNRQNVQNTKFNELNERFADAQFGSVRIFALFQPAITLATGIAMALVVWYGGGLVATKEVQLGLLVSYFAYVTSLFQPVREVADKWNVILSGMTSAERVFAILRWPEEDDKGDGHRLGFKGHIVFDNVSFAYKGKDWVLENFSLEIKPGESIGIVGATGSGKTTLISLLMRFYEPQKGIIKIDGIDIRDWNLHHLRSSIGFIQQDVFLFSGTVEENISLWRNSKTSTPSEDQELLHEGGSNLSRGQRQMIAFQRALQSQPKLWLLDEATANIDSASEKDLDRLLAQHASNCTTIVIAHRLSTVRALNRILVLHKGQIIEDGPHEDLLRRNGLYAKLYRYQSLNPTEHEGTEVRYDHQVGGES